MTTEELIPMDRLAKIYIKIRTNIQQLTQVYDKEIEDLKAQQASISSAMKEQMKAIGSKSINTEYGTVMMRLQTRYETHDWDSFKQFVITNDAVDLIERRIAQLNMAKFLEDNPGLVPPGLNSKSEYVISVKKPSK
jgi:hypothetical protein|tara:strand:- start:121 stop:528 length:408 start_codon:yes stop_codon:yes gene_type:complete